MNGENQLIPIIKDTCKEGYIESKDYDLLVSLSQRYNISTSKLDELIDKELERVKKEQLEQLFDLLQQPTPALKKKLTEQSLVANAFFPDLLNIGELQLNINKNITADAFLPTSGIKGITYVYDKEKENFYSSLQNIAIRLLMSVPVGKCRLTLVDENSGLSFSLLSGLDDELYTIIDDAKELETYLINLQKNTSSFIFKKIGNKYKDFNEYLQKNKKENQYFNIFLVNGVSCFTKDGIASLRKLFFNANKSGLFFLFTCEKNEFEQSIELKEQLVDNTFLYDVSTGESVSSNKELSKWFNQIYKLSVCREAVFNEDTLFEINKNYFPQKYKDIPLNNTSVENWYKDVESNIELPYYNTDEILKKITLTDKKNHIWCFSADKKSREKQLRQFVLNIVSEYSPNEIVLMNYGGNEKLFENLSNFPHWHTYLTGSSYVYFNDFINLIKDEITKRKELFETEKDIATYEEYRKIQKIDLPRLVVFINDIDKVIASAGELFASQLTELFNEIVSLSANYGIHFIVSTSLDDSIIGFNYSEFNYKLFFDIETISSAEIFMGYNDLFNQVVDNKELAVLCSENKKELINIDKINKEIPFDKVKEIISNSNTTNLNNHTNIVNTFIHRSFDDVKIGDAVDSIYIGEKQWLSSDMNYKLDIEKDLKKGILFTGKDSKALVSFVKSSVLQLLQSCDLLILDYENILDDETRNVLGVDIIDKVEIFIKQIEEYIENASSDLFDSKHLFIFLLGVDKLKDQKKLQQLSKLIEEIQSMNTSLFVNTNNYNSFTEAFNALSIYSFGTRIITKHSQEELVEPMVLFDDTIQLPNKDFEVLIYKENNNSEYVADIVKLFKV